MQQYNAWHTFPLFASFADASAPSFADAPVLSFADICDPKTCSSRFVSHLHNILRNHDHKSQQNLLSICALVCQIASNFSASACTLFLSRSSMLRAHSSMKTIVCQWFCHRLPMLLPLVCPHTIQTVCQTSILPFADMCGPEMKTFDQIMM